MIKWIVFDAMGVVFTIGDDTNDLLVPFIQKYNKQVSKKEINELYLQASLGQISSCRFWKEVGLEEQYPKIEILYLDTQLTLDNKFIPVAKAISKKYSIALLSNDVSEWSTYLRNKFTLDFLDVITISGDIQCRKPNLEIYKHFLTDSNSKAEECIFIDDRCKNLEAASSIGMYTVQFLRQEEKTDFIPDETISSFIELEDIIEKVANKSLCRNAHSLR